MPWPYSMLIVEATGDTLSATDYNNEHQNHINNNIPTSIDDLSATSTDAQTQADPFPSGGLSLATDLAGEVTRLRFAIAGTKGTTYWYQPPTNNLTQVLPLSGGILTGGLTLGGDLTMGDNNLKGLANGSEASPSVNFANSTTSGVYLDTQPTLALSPSAFNVNPTNTITATAHGYGMGTEIQISSTGSLPTGLAAATNYFVSWISANSFALSSTQNNALNGVKVAFTTQGTGQHTITPQVSTYALGIDVVGSSPFHVYSDRVRIGANHTGYQSSDLLVVEGAGNTVGNEGTDVSVVNTLTNAFARVITQVNTAPFTTLYQWTNGGADTITTQWPGGPKVQNAGYFVMQNTLVQFPQLVIGGGKPSYFYNDAVDASWDFVYGASGTSVFFIQPSGITVDGPPFYFSRVTTTQRNALSVSEGAMVFDTTLHHPFYYTGSTWVQI